MLKLLRQLSSRNLLLQTIKTLEQEQLELNRRNEAIQLTCLEQKAYLREAFHELRNGIHVIAGNSALLAKRTDGRQLPLQAMRLARNIREASHNMLHFLDAGLQFAKPEGTYEPDWQPLELRTWLERITGAYQYHADEKQLEIRCNIPDSFPAFIEMDALLFRQIVCNALHNAIKFSPSGSRVVIDCLEGSKEWSMVFINKSAHFEREQLKQIFEPFNTLGHAESSTGLGLSITRKYVEMLGGSIKASYWEDHFFLVALLPMRVSAGQPAHPPLLKDANNIPVVHTACRVLVIEDNPLSRRLICNYLHEIGLRQIAVTPYGKEGVLLAGQLVPHLVFIDAHLPDQDSAETVKTLRKVLEDDTPIIAMTADNMLSDNAPLLKAGASEYMLKPFELHQIAGIVQKYLDFAS
jgi:CheY-like chemotaxis protein